MPLVIGLDSSTQSTKALLVDAEDGTMLDEARALHPPGTQVDPRAWLHAADAVTETMGPRAAALSVGGQQHGMVALDSDCEPVRDALLWNDTRSADAAAALVEEWGGGQACADLIGSVLVASFTLSKLRWLREYEPERAVRVESVLLPHDYVSHHLAAAGTPAWTDRGDASGTGYFSTRENVWLPDLVEAALGQQARLPRVAEPGEAAAETARGQVLGAGTGDNMAAALGMDLGPDDVLVSVGTSGVASGISAHPVADGSGTVTGFADARGGFLPMVTTMNAAQILSLQADLLGVPLEDLSALALSAPAGAHGVTLLPYYGGERTPNRPHATGTWSGLRPSTTRADLARAAFEALLCALADAVDALEEARGRPAERVLLVGGATASEALRALAPAVLGRPVVVPAPMEYVARGAARQAAWALAGTPSPPTWPRPGDTLLEADPTPDVRTAYADLRDRTRSWS